MRANNRRACSARALEQWSTIPRTSWLRILVLAVGTHLGGPFTCLTHAQETSVQLLPPIEAELSETAAQQQVADSHAGSPQDSSKPSAVKQAKPPQPYKGSSLATTDFCYLEDPNNTAPYQPFDELKRIHIGDCLRLDIGGEYRNRYHVERNMRLTGEYNDFDLSRVRIYSDLWYGDVFRIYLEYIDGVSLGEEVTPRSIDENRSDLLQLFTDVGQEIDRTLSFQVTPRIQWVLGYCHFFSGDFIVRSAPANPAAAGDADFFYIQLGTRF